MRDGADDGIIGRMARSSRLARPLAGLSAALLAAACVARTEGAREVEGELAAGPAPVRVPAPDTLPARLARTLAGTIGERAVTVDVRVEAGEVAGWIRPGGPADVGRAFDGPWLGGSVDGSGAIALDEYAGEGGIRASWAGRLALAGGRMVLEAERTPVEGRPEAVRLEERGLALGGGARLVSRDLAVSDSVLGFEFYAEAPRVVGPDGGPPADPGLARLDAALAASAEEDRDAFVDAFGETEPDSLTERMIRETGPSWYEASYDAWLAADSVLSVEVSVSTYGTGAAHPNHGTYTLVWDLGAGRSLALEDLFRAGSAWPEAVSDAAVTILADSMGEMADEEWIRSGAGPDPGNFSAWSVVPGGLRIVFDPYQVASYADGPQTVVVPWASLAGVLDPAAPVATPGGRRVPSGPPGGP